MNSMRSRTLTLGILLVACTSAPSTSAGGGSLSSGSGASPAATPTGAVDAGGTTPPTPTASACQADGDCVVSCVSADQCCGQLCQCSNVYTRAALARIEAEHSRTCADQPCPIAQCMQSTDEVVARCTQGRCVAQRITLHP